MTQMTTSTGRGSIICQPHYKKTNSRAAAAALSEVFSRLASPSILGGNSARVNDGGFSYWAAEPKEVFEFSTPESRPFEKLHRVLDKYMPAAGCRSPLPKGIFCGGWVGFFGYELGRYIEAVPATTTDDLKMPLIRLCFYDALICYDHLEKVFWLVALQMEGDGEAVPEKLARLEELLTEAEGIDVEIPRPADIENVDMSGTRCNMDRCRYLEAVGRIKRYIYDGDVYQVNFSQRFESDYPAEPIRLFHWQNCYNPSAYSAYIDTGSHQIVSASPELFIRVVDDVIETRPIKGTRPRVSNSADAERINQRSIAELVNSEKERAELNMIIDLERNDVARICRPGSRKLSRPRSIETCPSVFHAAATIEGRLREGICLCDILRAMFPGGSITGAPKVSAMKIIDRTEPTARGVYTGSIGFVGIDGTACLNIAIRTIIITAGKAFVQVGGGIVADSEPQAEWQETITKARVLLAGINSVQHQETTTPDPCGGGTFAPATRIRSSSLNGNLEDQPRHT